MVLVRVLSPDQMGHYKIFFLYVTLCPGLFLVSGLTNGLYHWAGKYPETKPEIRQSWALLVGITLLICSIGLLFSHWIAPALKISIPDLALLLATAAIIIG